MHGRARKDRKLIGYPPTVKIMTAAAIKQRNWRRHQHDGEEFPHVRIGPDVRRALLLIRQREGLKPEIDRDQLAAACSDILQQWAEKINRYP